MKNYVSTISNAVQMKKIAIASALLGLSSPVFAAADTAQISAAQTTLLGYAAALLTLGIAVWAAMRVVRMFGGK